MMMWLLLDLLAAVIIGYAMMRGMRKTMAAGNNQFHPLAPQIVGLVSGVLIFVLLYYFGFGL